MAQLQNTKMTGSLLVSSSLPTVALVITGSSHFTGSNFMVSSSNFYVSSSNFIFAGQSADFSGVTNLALGTNVAVNAPNLIGIVPITKGGTGVNASDEAGTVKMTTGYVVYKASNTELQTFNTDGILYNKNSVGVQASAVTSGYVLRANNGAPAASIFQDNGTLASAGGAPESPYKLKVYGDLGVTGTVYETSTIKIKENIISLNDELSKIKNVRPVEFDYIDTGIHSYGFIAQELNEVYPDAVIKDDSGEPIGVAYADLTSPLMRAIQQLSEKLDDLAKRVEELENK